MIFYIAKNIELIDTPQIQINQKYIFAHEAISKSSDLSKAVKYYKEYLSEVDRSKPINPQERKNISEAFYYVALYFMQQNDFEKASKFGEQAIKFSNTGQAQVYARLMTAYAEYKNNENDKAVDLLLPIADGRQTGFMTTENEKEFEELSASSKLVDFTIDMGLGDLTRVDLDKLFSDLKTEDLFYLKSSKAIDHLADQLIQKDLQKTGLTKESLILVYENDQKLTFLASKLVSKMSKPDSKDDAIFYAQIHYQFGDLENAKNILVPFISQIEKNDIQRNRFLSELLTPQSLHK
jgi:tetratricopeptide (TPR) repeat protein